jgi:hypothetical protein
MPLKQDIIASIIFAMATGAFRLLPAVADDDGRSEDIAPPVGPGSLLSRVFRGGHHW